MIESSIVPSDASVAEQPMGQSRRMLIKCLSTTWYQRPDICQDCVSVGLGLCSFRVSGVLQTLTEYADTALVEEGIITQVANACCQSRRDLAVV